MSINNLYTKVRHAVLVVWRNLPNERKNLVAICIHAAAVVGTIQLLAPHLAETHVALITTILTGLNALAIWLNTKQVMDAAQAAADAAPKDG